MGHWEGLGAQRLDCNRSSHRTKTLGFVLSLAGHESASVASLVLPPRQC